MNEKLIYRAMDAGCKTASDLAKYMRGDELDWLKPDWQPKTVTHYTNRKDK